MVKKPKAYKRSKRKEQIIKQFRIWYENGYASEATSYKLAQALELTPQQRFRDLLNEMVLEGDLTVTERDQSGRYTTRFYSLSPSLISYHEKYGKRRIIVKHKGVERGQLELPL